jgi:predicted phosphodiesterase
MKIVAISDTHGKQGDISLPEGDVLVHAGDFSCFGSTGEWEGFFTWLHGLPFMHKILIAGNHDELFEDNPEAARRLLRTYGPSVTYLQDSGVEIDGVKFYGSPWTPRYNDWGFNLDRGEPLAEKWAMIPEDTNVLITHGPPFGVLDQIPSGLRIGCEALDERVRELNNLKAHIFGHIHGRNGAIMRSDRTCLSVNAAICDEAYRPYNVVQSVYVQV